MKGVLEGSKQYQATVRLGSEACLPFGTRLTSSNQVIGISKSLLLQRKPFPTCFKGASPHRRSFCLSLKAGLASTRKILSMLCDRVLNLLVVCIKPLASILLHAPLWGRSPYPQYIIHQCPSARSDFNDLYTHSPPLSNPFRDHPYADELSKDLRYLRRRDKVAFRAKLIAFACFCCIVAAVLRCEALPHVLRYGDWTCSLTEM